MSDEHYYSLGLTDKQHAMAMSQPRYVEFFERYQTFQTAVKESEEAVQSLTSTKDAIEKLLNEEFLTQQVTANIMSISPYKVGLRVADGTVVGVRWRRSLYILIDSLREAGYEV